MNNDNLQPANNSDATIDNASLSSKSELIFKNSFWRLFIAVVILQIFNVVLAAQYGFDREKLPSEFYLISELGGIVWFLALVGMVVVDLKGKDVSLQHILNLKLSVLKQYFPKVLKYFAGCSLFVIALSFLSPGSELHLENQTSLTILLTSMTVVILAPVCEEIAFRGYLYTSMLSGFKRKKERLVVNAMLFAAAHVLLIELLLGGTVPFYIFVIGYLLANLYEESRSVLPCVVLHALNNGLVFAIDIFKTFVINNADTISNSI